MREQMRLSESTSANSRNSVALPAFYPPVSPLQEFEPTKAPIPLSHYLWIIRRQVWRMIAFAVACVLSTFVLSVRMQPVYESTATVDIDRQAPSEVVGQDSTRTTGSNDADQFMATQIKIIQSDAVLRPIAERYRLLERERQVKSLSSEKGQRLAKAPTILKRLKVIRPPSTYLLQITYRSTDPQLAADVANAIANSYLLRAYEIRIQSSASLSTFMEKQLDELKAKMERSSLALAQFEKDMDVINPEQKTNILSARLLQLNTEYTNAQAERVRMEAAWNAIKSGSVEAAQVSTQGEPLTKLTDALNQAQQRFATIKATYGTSHPEYRKAASELAEVQKQFNDTVHNITDRIETQYKESLNREQMLDQAVTETKAEWDHINARSYEYQQLKQEADADKALYDELIKKIRESDINVGFQNNNIRIADVARPSAKPVFPNVLLNILLASIFSILLAIGAAILIDSLDTTLRDPEEASRFLGIDVIGALPVDRSSAILSSSQSASPASLVSAPAPAEDRKSYYSSRSGFDEAIRTLRNTILLSDFEGRLHSLVLTSATPSEGKTTIAAHLAIANAAREKKTLLVDADLRRPSLHTRFGVDLHEGLSNVLVGELPWEEVVLPVEGKPNLSLLPAGPGSHRAADLIGPRLSNLLDEFGKVYDLVILDAPPLLGFAECLQMATAADGVLIVSRAAQTRRKAVAEVVATLRRLRANIVGVVLNQVSHNTSADGYSYYDYYGKYYSRYYSKYREPSADQSN